MSDLTTCLYCETQIVYRDDIPAPDDDATWAARATEHATWCWWVATRAHSRTVSVARAPGPTWHERYQMGIAGLRELDTEIVAWRSAIGCSVDLGTWLGLTRDEYARFVEGGVVAIDAWTRAQLAPKTLLPDVAV